MKGISGITHRGRGTKDRWMIMEQCYTPRSVSLGRRLSGRVEVVKRDGVFQQETRVMGEKKGCLVRENVLSSRKEPGSLER